MINQDHQQREPPKKIYPEIALGILSQQEYKLARNSAVKYFSSCISSQLGNE